MSITKPKLPKHLETKTNINHDFFESWQEDISIEMSSYINQALEYQSYRQLEIRTSLFDHIFFDHFELTNGYLLDVVLEGCDLANAHFSNTLFRRVIFKSCKLVGADFSDCSFDQVLFDNCLMPMSNFSHFTSKGIHFQQCDMNNTSFMECLLKKVSWKDCKLTHTEFLHAPLANVDLTTCQIDGISLTLNDLKGAIVTSSQALALSHLLGLQIKDDF